MELHKANPSTFKEEAARKLIGAIVLTRYNNHTYRIDDIAWQKNPASTFQKADGSDMTFIEYYKSVLLF